MQPKLNISSIEARAIEQEEDDDVSWFRHNLNKLPGIVLWSWTIPLVTLVIVTIAQTKEALVWIEVACAIAATVSILAIVYGLRVCKKIEQIEQVPRTFYEHLKIAQPKKV